MTTTTKVVRYVRRTGHSAGKKLMGLARNHAPDSKPVFIFGAQRSGTTMLLECFDQSLRFEVFGEMSKAMSNFRIKPNEEISQMIHRCRQEFIVFKPLTDSHRVAELLSLSPASFAIWAFRRVEDRVNSSVAKFGDHNLKILADLARGIGFERWQAQGLSSDDIALIKQFDYSQMSPYDASAIFWLLRNRLYFNQKLEQHSNVLPLSYERLAADPADTMQGICRFIGARYDDSMVSSVHPHSIGRSESKVSAEITALCQPLYQQLDDLQTRLWNDLT